jgi:pimeloyl-ACP methyl ester carboxylesterase
MKIKPSKFLTVYEEHESTGEPIILIHGGAGGIWTWTPTIQLLPEFYCLMPELPEHGSSQSNGFFSIKSTADQIIGFIKETQLRRISLVGLSVGGQIAVEILAKAPELIKCAVISGALTFPLPGYRIGLYSEAIMAFLYRVGVHPWKRNDAWIRLNMKTSAGMPESGFSDFKKNFQSLTLSGWTNAMSEFYRYRLPDGLEKANVPTLLVAGMHEKTDIQPTNLMLSKKLPSVKSTILGKNEKWTAAQEHNWSVTFPEICAATIRAWINHEPLPKELSEIS